VVGGILVQNQAQNSCQLFFLSVRLVLVSFSWKMASTSPSSLLQRFFFYILVISCLVLEVHCAKTASRKRKAGKFKRFQLFGYFVIGFFVCLFGPALYTFINALRKDPAVPQMIKALVQETRKKSISFLGTQEPVVTHDHPH
jgi:uncharacterized membrane protein YfcA